MIATKRIPPKTGKAFKLKKGQLLKVVTPKGGQVSDLVAFNMADKNEKLSNGKTFDYEQTLRLTTGNTLYSNRSNSMLSIVEDTCGVHDFLLAPCCPVTMKHFYQLEGDVPSCLNNLHTNLKPYDIQLHEIPTAFNIFMNVEVRNYNINVLPPSARSGDYILFRAQMDLLIGMTSCSAGASNDFKFSSIAYEILDE